MVAVMNTTAETQGEIPLMRNSINIQVSFLNFISALLGRTDLYSLKVLETKLHM